ncbi:MAG: VTT domain-containing protein [Actinomycetota bacterium]
MLAILALLNVENILKSGGLALLAVIVFAESGMLVGFFLPGDSLLFIAGFLASTAGGNKLPALPWVILTVVIAAIVGDQVGYLIGRKLGPRLFNRENSRLLNPKNIDKTQVFFEHHGPKSIVLARFVPVVRAFVAVIAGAGRMNYRTFVSYNIIGGALWGIGLPILGFYLGERKWVKDNIEIVLILVVVLSLVPVAIELLRHRRAAARTR